MKLKSFGCSFVFGTDLHDDGSNTDHAKYSRHTWPALLAQQLGYQYFCYARPGSGNLRIAETVLTHAALNDPALFVIGWTWIDRFDYTEQDNQWKTLMPVDHSDTARLYYRDLHSQYRDKLSTLMSIRLVIHTLQQKGHQFIMTNMDHLVFESHQHCTPSMMEMQKFTQPFVCDLQGKNFLEWSQSQQYQISATLHPLEDAHRAACDLICQDLAHCIKS